MLEYADPKQSAARDRHLKHYLSMGEDSINRSVQNIVEIRDDFDKWKKLTNKLLRALEDKKGNIHTQVL
ncbi:MAG: hypothetical protein CL912_13915 [Deltaproteobacteria bacterium]|nr:hypothetical protein [Deltaproteobacteria bacterium]